MNEMFYFRIKTEWTKESEDGTLGKTKTEELVQAVNYTDAERIANELAKDRSEFGCIDIEISRTKIQEILYSDVLCKDSNLVGGLVHSYFEEAEDSGVGFYAVKVMFVVLDERTGKEKKSNEVIYVPANSNTDAAEQVANFLDRNDTRTFVIRDIKYDKAEAILWTPETYQDKTKVFDELYNV